MRVHAGARTALALKILLAIAVVITLVAILIDLESTSRGLDAYGELVGAQRAALTHQPFYVGATDQKGPLWLSAYSVAYYLVGMRDAWWVIAVMVMLAAAGTSYAAFRFSLVQGRDRLIALAAAVTLFLNLTINEYEYGHLLYSRNIVSLLFASAFAIVAVSYGQGDRSRRAMLLRLAAAGVLAGLAVQTNIASAPTAVVLTGLVSWFAYKRHRSDRKQFAIAAGVFAGAALVALLSALVWYTARGAGPEFRELWWNYNRTYASGTGLSVFGALRKGAHDFSHYYQNHPVLTLIIVAFLFDWARRARQKTATAFDAALVGWWLAECLAVALAQRFFDQYLVLPFVPVSFMGITLAARYGGLIAGWARPAAAAAIVLVALFIAGGPQSQPTYEAVRAPNRVSVYKRLFTTPLPLPRAEARRHDRERPELVRLRAVVDKYSNKNDWVFAWTGEPETYYRIKRPEATRFGVNQWLWGVIPGGDIAPKYVPKDAWQDFGKDFIDTPPKLWIEQAQWLPLPSYLPLTKIRDCAFKLVFQSSEQRVYKRVKPIAPCIKAADLPAVDAADDAARAAK